MEDVNAFVEKMDTEMGETLTDEVVILKRIGNWPKRCALSQTVPI